LISYAQQTELSENYLLNKIKEFLVEDIPDGDKTSIGTVPQNAEIIAEIQAVEDLVFSGGPVINATFKGIASVKLFISEGDKVKSGEVIGTITGNAIKILSRERVMLNLIQRMSGIATNVKSFTEIADKHNVWILDTRKTTPGLRKFEKYAVICGGGKNHRFSLSDGILIKDNHIQSAGGVTPAIQMIKAEKFNLPIELEVDFIEQIKEALEIGVDGFLLDNMTPEEAINSVNFIREFKNGNDIFIESSGGMTFDTFKNYLKTGINAISIGGLTHSVKSSDIRLEFKSI
jgi:nicotinate-nucleotide pyrophosphorylase (carboxylating)